MSTSFQAAIVDLVPSVFSDDCPFTETGSFRKNAFDGEAHRDSAKEPNWGIYAADMYVREDARSAQWLFPSTAISRHHYHGSAEDTSRTTTPPDLFHHAAEKTGVFAAKPNISRREYTLIPARTKKQVDPTRRRTKSHIRDTPDRTQVGFCSCAARLRKEAVMPLKRSMSRSTQPAWRSEGCFHPLVQLYTVWQVAFTTWIHFMLTFRRRNDNQAKTRRLLGKLRCHREKDGRVAGGGC